LSHLECNVHVPGNFSRIEPDKVAVQPKMQCEAPAAKHEQEVLTAALDGEDLLPAHISLDQQSGLHRASSGGWPHCYRMNHAAALDSATYNKRAQSSRDGFDLGKFRHGWIVSLSD
jgi:hypothetical protein